MIAAALILGAWPIVGLTCGIATARMLPGPQDSPAWGLLWALAWPAFLLIERSPGNG